MVRIVYGVSGEGSGHSSRAREIASHLRDRGHDVRLASYDRGYRNLRDNFEVTEIEGLTITSDDNRVSKVRTFTDNLARLPAGHRRLQELRRELFESFQPQCVLTDFEPMTAYLARHYDLPLISIDNQHRMRYMEYETPPGLKGERRMTKAIIRAMVPKPDVSLVTTFVFGEVTNRRTFLFPPILRREVLERQPRQGEHLLVYLTSGYESLLDELKEQFPREHFLVYGYDRDERDGPLQYRPFSREGFLDDLASARAVLATAGFTLISESLYLQKPYLAMPMEGQFEQQLNAFLLHQAGFGLCCRERDRDSIAAFLYDIPLYTERLAAYDRGDQQAIKGKLDDLLADDAALAREHHVNRRNYKKKESRESPS